MSSAQCDDQILARLQASFDAGRDLVESEIANAPSAIPCRLHSEALARLDHEASVEAAKPVYVCAQCQSEKRASRLNQRQERAGIPRNLRQATLENFKTKRPDISIHTHDPCYFLECAQELIDAHVRNVILAGGVGIGKSHLAAACASWYISAGFEVQWVRVATLFEAVHATFDRRRSDVTRADVIRRYAKPRMLVLDELGQVRMPEDGECILYDILDYRDQHALQTIGTTNLPGPALEDWIGDRCTSRLYSGGLLFGYGNWADMRSESMSMHSRGGR